MWANLKTEFSFGAVYGFLDDVAAKCATMGDCAGMCDMGNTFGHVRWRKACKKAGIKPIYGVVLPVVDTLEHNKDRRYAFNQMTFIARNASGLQEIYGLVDDAHKQFYYRQRLTYGQVSCTSDNIFVLSGVACRWDLLERDVFQELSPATPYSQRVQIEGVPSVACLDNYMTNADDTDVYQAFAEDRKLERKTTLMHVLTPSEWLAEFPGRKDALKNLLTITDACNVELPIAPMVRYLPNKTPKWDNDIKEWCIRGAVKRNLDIISPGEYKDRYEREINLIIEKQFDDYFLVVADLIRYCKTKMCVGPGRGSAAGSLVCFLMGITEVDPLKYNLFFERFIDINRMDMPDIDVDFQDDKRPMALKYLQKKYGPDCVVQLGNFNLLKPKSALIRFAKALCIPENDIQEFKESIEEGSAGDKRKNKAIEDSFETEIGVNLLEKHPAIEVVKRIEGHASHTGVHAGAIIVCNEPITRYAGVNSREATKRIAMIDKKDAEEVNLLKIDALGLRTLSVLSGVCDQLNKPYGWLYEIPLDDPEVFRVFNDRRYNGIFQFEGAAIQKLSGAMILDNIEDVSALCALGRPGPLGSGGASAYIKVRTGKAELVYLSNHPYVVSATRNTFGMIVYQEQMLVIAREYGGFSWEECGKLRKGVSKSMGAEFFAEFKERFIKGAIANGDTEEIAGVVWEGIQTMGGYAFNKSHSVSYGVLSYLCAYMKAYHPLEFVVSSLNHTKDDNSAIKILRDGVEIDDIKYTHLDPEKSQKQWSVQDGHLYGGLLSIHGIAESKANKYLKCKREGTAIPAGIKKSVTKAVSPFKYLYPGRELYGDFYTDHEKHNLNYPPAHIKNIKDVEGEDVTFIGRLLKMKTKDENEEQAVSRRNGEFLQGLTTSMIIVLEDDTGEQLCKIPVDLYGKVKDFFAQDAKVDKDWFLVYGYKTKYVLIVKNIQQITRDI